MEKTTMPVSVKTAEKPNYESEIIQIIRENVSPKAMLYQLENYHGSDIADVMEQLNEQERRKLFRICPADMLAETFSHLEEERAGEYLNEIPLKKVTTILEELETDAAVEILRTVGKEKRELIIDALEEDIKKEIQLIASFDEEEIGSRMTTNCITLRENITVKDAMNELIRQAEENDNISTLFVVDDTDCFYGAIALKDLITARSYVPLESLIATSFPYVYATETIDACIEQLKDYSEDLIPVLDNQNKMLGVITAQSLIDVVDEEMGEDYAMLAGLTAEEDLNEPLKQSMKKRLPWLFALLLLGLLVSAVVGAFEKVVAQLTLIMAFQSLILDMSGNVGTQSLAVTIRVLMDENLTFRNKLKLVGKEMRIGFFNGLLLGILSFIMVGLYIMLFKHKAFLFSFAISGCIGISLILAMLISSGVGTLIPLFFKKIKVDPAVASGPLITTVNDLVAVVTYYGMSWILLLNILKIV